MTKIRPAPFEEYNETDLTVAYFSSWDEAKAHGTKHAGGYPYWRIVPYGLGYAVQVRGGGDYFSLSGKLCSE
jgi:hypothetical protein